MRRRPAGFEGKPLSDPPGPGIGKKPHTLPSQEGEPPLPEVRNPAPGGLLPPDLPHPTTPVAALAKVTQVAHVTTRTGRLTSHVKIEPLTLLGRTIRTVPLPAGTPVPSPGDLIIVHIGPGRRPVAIAFTRSRATAPRCTSCGTRASLQADRLTSHCANDACPERRAKQLIHMTGPNGLSIQGYGPKISRTLYEKEYVQRPEDIFSLDWVPLMLIPGVSAARARALVTAAETCRDRPLHLVLSALGMPSAGPTTVDRLLASNPDLTSLQWTTKRALASLPSIGIHRAAAIAAWWQNPANVLTYTRLLELGVIQRTQKPPKGDDCEIK